MFSFDRGLGFFIIFLYKLLGFPTRKYLRYYWNLGRFLGFVLMAQVFTGVCLCIHYTPTSGEAFSTVDYIMREVPNGWLIRTLHSGGASLFMVLMYLHMLKGFYIGRLRLTSVWASGVLILMMSMGAAFFGYVLVWSQISYWAAVVITSLVTVLPWGEPLLYWIWGGFNIGTAFLHLSFVLHFILPWFILFIVVVHLQLLHKTGSTSVIYYSGVLGKHSFWPYYFVKDFLNFLPWLGFFAWVFFYPFIFYDPEIFMEANPLSRPMHIVPEWYFCSYYGILRSIPNKALGVFFLLLSVLILLVPSVLPSHLPLMSLFNKLVVNGIIARFILLGWLGQAPAIYPYIFFGFLVLCFYFFFILLLILVNLAAYLLFG